MPLETQQAGIAEHGLKEHVRSAPQTNGAAVHPGRDERLPELEPMLYGRPIGFPRRRVWVGRMASLLAVCAGAFTTHRRSWVSSR